MMSIFGENSPGVFLNILIVVNNPKDWELNITGIELVSARSYLLDPKYTDIRNVKVFNLCKSYKYQTTGYYVSLLASARGHKPIPNITSIQDMKSQTIIRFVSDDLEDLIQKCLSQIQTDKFSLNIYFGRSLAKKYERISLHLFKQFQFPFMKAVFQKEEDGWILQNLSPISADGIPNEHHEFVNLVASEYFKGKRPNVPKKQNPRYDLAILYDPDAKDSPSDEKAIQNFIKAAENLGMGAELISKEDYGSIAEFDALFIRETTNVNHYTYRFARRAQAEGLVVVDDPESILKCTNKVYLAELLDRFEIAMPKTIIVHKDNIDKVISELGLPCILKQPDSSFSNGVVKIETPMQLLYDTERYLDKSELLIAQEFLPTTFDWRIGVFDRQVLFSCKYFMSGKHWQIVKRDSKGKARYGRFESVSIENTPKEVISMALKISNLIGDGLYGVDIKQAGKKFAVIEINDNPNIESGVEDGILKEKLYQKIMEIFLKRIEKKKGIQPKVIVPLKTVEP